MSILDHPDLLHYLPSPSHKVKVMILLIPCSCPHQMRPRLTLIGFLIRFLSGVIIIVGVMVIITIIIVIITTEEVIIIDVLANAAQEPLARIGNFCS